MAKGYTGLTTVDIAGQKFGRLTVICEAGKVPNRKEAQWCCVCECGEMRFVNGCHLRSGNTVSCGCAQREHAAKQGPRIAAQRVGIPLTAEHKEKIGQKSRAYRASRRCENYPAWKGNKTLAHAIGNLPETRKWVALCKDRDRQQCIDCGDTEKLEVHHVIPTRALIVVYGVKVLSDALKHPIFFDISNGETLCPECHRAKDAAIWEEFYMFKYGKAVGHV